MTQVKVIARCSFPYKYKQRQVYLTSGETLYLDDIRDKDEIAYLLGESFPYREFIFVDGARHLSKGFQQVDEELHLVPMLPLYNPYPDTVPYTHPPLDAPENPHIVETLLTAGVVLPPEDTGAINQPALGLEPSENPALAIPVINDQLGQAEALEPLEFIQPRVELIEPAPPAPQVSEREKRFNELKHMTNVKLKEVAKTYQIEFINKQEAIASILALEFEDE